MAKKEQIRNGAYPTSENASAAQLRGRPSKVTSQGIYRRRPRVNAFDGVRALAILSILLYHLSVRWLPSGHMGVVVFLTLSGYLAASSLLEAIDRRGLAALPRALAGRLTRLYPPLVAMIVLATLLCALFSRVLLTKMRPDVLPALGSFLNWWYIFNGASYFDQIGGPSPLTHLWYISVDLQAFVGLALLIWGGRKLGLSRRGIGRGLLVVAAASALAMALLYDPSADPSRVYYGVDTRAFSVALGAWLACIWPIGRAPIVGRRLLSAGLPQNRNAAARVLARKGDLMAGLALVAIGAISLLTPATSSWLYWGGMLLVSLLACLLLAGLLMPGGRLKALLSSRPLCWLGSRSYSLYLWHFPIIQLIGAGNAGAPWPKKLVAALVSLVASEIAFRAFDDSRTRRRIRTLVSRAGAALRRQAGARRLDVAATAGLAVVLALVTATSIFCLVTLPDEVLLPQDAVTITGVAANQAVDLTQRKSNTSPDDASEKSHEEVGEDRLEGSLGEGSEELFTWPSDKPYEQMREFELSVVRDRIAQESRQAAAEIAPGADAALESVRESLDKFGAVPVPEGPLTVWAAPQLTNAGLVEPIVVADSVAGGMFKFEDSFPNGFLDSYVGRLPHQAVETYNAYEAQGVVGNVVIFACFTNAEYGMPEVYEQMVEAAGPDREIFMIGVVDPTIDADSINASLQAVCDAHDNVHFIDWPAVSSQYDPDFIFWDGIHVTYPGGDIYTDMVAQAVAPYMVGQGSRVKMLVRQDDSADDSESNESTTVNEPPETGVVASEK